MTTKKKAVAKKVAEPDHYIFTHHVPGSLAFPEADKFDNEFYVFPSIERVVGAVDEDMPEDLENAVVEVYKLVHVGNVKRSKTMFVPKGK